MTTPPAPALVPTTRIIGTYLCHKCQLRRHNECRPVSPSGRKTCRCRCRLYHRNSGPRPLRTGS